MLDLLTLNNEVTTMPSKISWLQFFKEQNKYKRVRNINNTN